MCSYQGLWRRRRKVRRVLGHLPTTPVCPSLAELDPALAAMRAKEILEKRPPVRARCSFEPLRAPKKGMSKVA